MTTPMTLSDVVDKAVKNQIPNGWDRIGRFQKVCDDLIMSVQKWLEPKRGDALIQFDATKPFDLVEHGFTYSVNGWSFTIGGNKRVDFRPRGTWVIGAYGRMDMIGQPGSQVVLTLNETNEWELPTIGRTKATYKKLDESTFPEALNRALTF